jgi:hypothetical protein
MKTFVLSCLYLAQFFLEWQTFHTEFVEKIQPHILCSITFFRKSCLLWDNVEKCAVREATEKNIIRRMRTACWITKATDTHSECVILNAFLRQQWFHESPSMLRLYIHACLVKLLLLYFSWPGNFPQPLFPLRGTSGLLWTLFGNRFSSLFLSSINPVTLQTA